MPTLNVELASRTYPIHIGTKLLENAAATIAPLLKRPRVFIIMDAHVEKLHANALTSALKKQSIESHVIVISAGEKSKNLTTIEKILNQILDHAPERSDMLIALGGGVVGDITGFVASILLRGVPFVQIPTTLLSMVDSSVGGKTGVNSAHGKNLIGSFYQPKSVLIDIDVLSTLPKRELLAGYAEIVKYGLIRDKKFFDWLDKNHADVLALKEGALTHAIFESCAMKANIVANDERESGERALLNLGHTFGHALEKRTGYSDALLHGEAVSIGTILAFEFSAELGICNAEEVKKVKTHFEKTKLPTTLPTGYTWSAKELLSDMFQDKKVEAGNLVLILARAIGDAFVEKKVSAEKLEKFLSKIVAA